MTFNHDTFHGNAEPATERCCPDCGSAARLYKRGGGLRWCVTRGAWVEDPFSGIDAEVECTACDWSGPEEDTLIEVVEA